MVTGLLLPVLLGFLGFRLGGTVMGGVAAVLAALSPTLIRFSNECKPYGVDPFVSVALVTAAWLVAERPAATGRWWALWGVGLAGLLGASPAVFVLGAITAGLWLHAGRDPVLQRRAVVLGAAWGLAIVLLFLGYYRTPAGNPGLNDGYGRALLAPGRDLWDRLALAAPGTLLPAVTGDGANVPRVPGSVSWALGAAYALGALCLARRRGLGALVMVAGPLALA